MESHHTTNWPTGVVGSLWCMISWLAIFHLQPGFSHWCHLHLIVAADVGHSSLTHTLWIPYKKTSSYRNGSESGCYKSLKKYVKSCILGGNIQHTNILQGKHSTIHHRERPGSTCYQVASEGEIHANYSGQVKYGCCLYFLICLHVLLAQHPPPDSFLLCITFHSLPEACKPSLASWQTSD